MPYLICDKCNVYYEIEKKSEMSDFHTCECGNELKYYETINEYMNEGLDNSGNINDDLDGPGGNKKGVFYSVNKKNLVTLQMEMLKEDEETKKQERLKRDLNYKINHALAEQKEKMSNSSNKYEPLIVKEFGDKSLKNKKEMLLREMELLKESKDQ
jgi:hypothetical protein